MKQKLFLLGPLSMCKRKLTSSHIVLFSMDLTKMVSYTSLELGLLLEKKKWPHLLTCGQSESELIFKGVN